MEQNFKRAAEQKMSKAINVLKSILIRLERVGHIQHLRPDQR